MLRILTGLWLFGHTAWALDTPHLTYSTDLDDRFDYYVQILEKGYPLGKVESKPSTGGGHSNAIPDLQKAMRKGVADLQAAYEKAERDRAAQLTAGPAGTLPAAGAAQTPPAVTAFSKESLGDFEACATRTLPALKKALQAEAASGALALDLLMEPIDAERGDGSQVTKLGVACGKYLGNLGTISRGRREDVKLLAALSSRTAPADERALFGTFFLYGRGAKDSPLKTSGFWSFAWSTLSLLAVFGDKSLPSLDELTTAYLNGVQDGTGTLLRASAGQGIAVSLGGDDLKSAIAADWRTAEEALKGVLE